MEIKTSSPQALIFDMIKTRFSSTLIWRVMEPQLALMCSEIPPVYDDVSKDKLISQLLRIKGYLIEKGANLSDLDFIDEEISSYIDTKQISLYNEQDDLIDEETILRFIGNSAMKEGVISTSRAFNWGQLAYLTRKIFERTDLVKFFISPEVTLKGQIVAEMYEVPVEIPVATVHLSKKEEEAGIKTVSLFGQKVDTKKWSVLKEINVHFYVYRFVTENNEEFLVLSHDKKTIGEYILKGVVTKVNDYKKVTDSLKLGTKMPYIFAYSMTSRILQFKSVQEFRSRVKLLGITRSNMFDFPFTVPDGDRLLVLKHPLWFKWLMWSWLVHANRGQAGFNEYPLHILWVGPPSTGKSSLINALHARSNEQQSIFSGSSSTMKRLIPSFKGAPAKIGYLAQSNRFAFLDELFRCITRTTPDSTDMSVNEAVALMNDLLEHQRREAGSGISSVHINMTARCLAATNPIREIKSVPDIMKKFDTSFMSRWLIYWQTEDHCNMIQKSNGILAQHYFNITTHDWVSILDYMHTLKVTYDDEKIKEIYDSVLPILSRELLDLYKTRHHHHLICILDGIVKTNWLFDRETVSINANKEDYEILEMVWKNVIKSWINTDDLRNLPPKDKYYFLPEIAQWLYDKISAAKRPLTNFEMQELAFRELKPTEFYTNYQILMDQGMITSSEGLTRPFWMKESETQSI